MYFSPGFYIQSSHIKFRVGWNLNFVFSCFFIFCYWNNECLTLKFKSYTSYMPNTWRWCLFPAVMDRLSFYHMETETLWTNNLKHAHVKAHTPISKQFRDSKWTFMFLDCGKKPAYPQADHSNYNKKDSNWNLNTRPFCCKSALIPTGILGILTKWDIRL